MKQASFFLKKCFKKMRLLKLCSLNLLIFLITCTKYSTISCSMEVGYHNPTVVASMGTKFDAAVASAVNFRSTTNFV
jgi:hypothetical protein